MFKRHYNSLEGTDFVFSPGQYPTIFADETLFKVWPGDLTERNLYDTPSRMWYRVLREVGGR